MGTERAFTRLGERVEALLPMVRKPARYAGGEYNAVVKTGAPFNFLMCFPDVYEIAASNLGIKILYDVLNRRPDTFCEYCFAPWDDFAALLRENDIPLYGLTTRRPASEFQMVGFSLQYELSYTGVLYMLDLMNLPLRAADRGVDAPLVIGGGPCAVNPLPLADFFDLFLIGDGERAVDELASLYLENKRGGGGKADYLLKASKMRGVYVPSVHTAPAPFSIRREIIPDLNSAPYPVRPIVPNVEVVHDRAVLEIFRGCARGCRYCQAGYIYRPRRERALDACVSLGAEIIDNTGYGELSLSSLSSGDYSRIGALWDALGEKLERKKTALSLPSLRVDSNGEGLKFQSKSASLTFAPEAGTQRLRDIINKNITEEDITGACLKAKEAGCKGVKLYFMLGLPFETDEDREGIIKLCSRIKKLGLRRISVSCALFVPKPFTPFQWARQLPPDEARQIQGYLKAELRRMGISFNYHGADTSRIEAAFARGDRKLGGVLEAAYRAGCVFDGWTEKFDGQKWETAFTERGLSVGDYTRGYGADEALPWDFVDIGTPKAYLAEEWEKAAATARRYDSAGEKC